MRFHDYFHLIINYDLRELYEVLSLRIFVFSLVGVYVPLYFLKKGMSILQVSYYYVYVQIVLILGYYLLALLIRYVAPKYFLMGYAPFLFIHLYLLTLLKKPDLWLISLIGLTYAISLILFWMPFKLLLSESIESKNSGKEIGLIKLINLLIKILNPFVGALIIKFFGFKSLYLVGMFFLVISMIPVLKVRSNKRYLLDMSYIRDNFFKKKSSVYFAEGSTGISEMLFWPIFVFIVLKTYLAVGVLQSVANAFILVITGLITSLSDRVSKEKLVHSGTVGYSISWLIRQATRLPFLVFLSGIYAYIAQNFLMIPYVAEFYALFKKNHPFEAIFLRQIHMNIGRLVAVILFILFLFNTSVINSFVSIFLFSAVISFLFFLF